MYCSGYGCICVLLNCVIWSETPILIFTDFSDLSSSFWIYMEIFLKREKMTDRCHFSLIRALLLLYFFLWLFNKESQENVYALHFVTSSMTIMMIHAFSFEVQYKNCYVMWFRGPDGIAIVVDFGCVVSVFCPSRYVYMFGCCNC